MRLNKPDGLLFAQAAIGHLNDLVWGSKHCDLAVTVVKKVLELSLFNKCNKSGELVCFKALQKCLSTGYKKETVFITGNDY